MQNLSKLDKLKKLGLESNIALPDRYVDKLYEYFKEELNDKIIKESSSNKEDIKNFKRVKNKVDESDPKCIVLLKLINCILNNLNKPMIKKLTEFINVDRDDIIKKVNFTSFERMENEIFQYFDKKKSGWYRRNKVEYYILTFLRYACDDIGYNFIYVHKTRQKDSINKTHYFYTIK